MIGHKHIDLLPASTKKELKKYKLDKLEQIDSFLKKLIEYKDKNREVLKEKRRIWESKTGYLKNWRKLNSEKVVEYRKKSFEKLKSNPEKYEKRLNSQNTRNKIKYANNPEIYKEKAKQYYLLNKENASKANREWAKKYPEKVLEIKRKYARNNPAKVLANVRKRQLQKKQAIPKWVDERELKAIKQLYIKARELTKKTGVPHEVDHIIPLKSDTVCGLHVHDNLQIITRFKNRSKGNKF